MSRDVERLCKGMSDSVWVKAMGLGRCLADIRLTLDSKLLFDLVAASQSGRPKPYGIFSPVCYTWPGWRTHILKIVCIIGIEVGRHRLRAGHGALDQVVGHFVTAVVRLPQAV